MLAADLILCKILQNKDLHIVKTNGLEGKHFQNREPEFNYIMDHFKQYGNVPDPIVLLSHLTIMELLGHKNIETTMRYAHVIPGKKMEAIKKLITYKN